MESTCGTEDCRIMNSPEAKTPNVDPIFINFEPPNSAAPLDLINVPLQASPLTVQLFESVTGKGNWEQLSTHLDRCTDKANLMEVDEDRKTVLHHSVLGKDRKMSRLMSKAILDHWKSLPPQHTEVQLVDMQDLNGNTALHLAVESGREKVASVLLEYKPDLSLKTYDLQGENWKMGINGLELIQNKTPKLLRFQFDEGVRWVDDEQEQLSLNFNKITESHYNFANIGADELDKLKESNNFSGVLKGRSEDFDSIFSHPLVQVFLYLKHRRAYPFILMSIIIHILWHIIYAYFIFKIYYSNCPWKPIRNETNISSGEVSIECKRENMDAVELVFGILCWLLGFIFFGKELFEICTSPSVGQYFKQLENIGQLFVCGSVIIISWPLYEYLGGSDVIAIHPWQYKVSAVTEFVVWTLILGQICKIQGLRIYIEIFLKVVKSFGMFICTFACLLFAFASALCILMPEAKPFTSPWLAVPKVLVMMTGELNYDEVFYGDVGSGSSPDHYLTTQVLFSLFTILMSMVLLNMLIGLAVADTQELRQQSHIAELYGMLEEIYLMECFAFRLHKELRMPWLLKRLSINQNTQDTLNDPLTRCLFRNKNRDERSASKLGSYKNLHGNPKILVDYGLFYIYDTTKRNKDYPISEELIGKLIDIADENNK